jgi:hypothetical protein
MLYYSLFGFGGYGTGTRALGQPLASVSVQRAKDSWLSS